MWQEGDLLSLARAKWRSSGLTDEQAAKLQLEPLTKDEVVQLGHNFQRAGAVRIPYFDSKGKPTQFFRLRYLEKLPGFATAKPQRYVQPAGTLNEIYMPPLLDTSWYDIQRDRSADVVITEGEFKSAAGCAAAMATIGLGGVDVWRSSRRLLELLPALEEFIWEGRRVIICYDSDAATNPNVVRAQRQLAKELLAKGAIPCVASLPPAKDGTKQGLDDFLVAKGKEALEELLKEAPMYPEADALWEMNEEVCYVREPGLVVVRATGQRLGPGSFVQHAYSNRHYIEFEQTKKGLKQTKKPLAKRWVDWERRFTLNRITYRPGQSPMVDNEWNQWRGWGVEPKEGDIGPWTRLMDFIFKEQQEAREFFQKWLAYPLQHPGAKMYVSTLIWGVEHGTGKSLIAHTMKPIYGTNFVEIKNKHLKGGFNEWAENKQFVYGDEITGSDKRSEADYIKGLITQPVMRINAKFMPSFDIPDCINYYFSSNQPDALFLEDTDRRFFIHEVIGKPETEEFYAEYDRWLHGPGPAHLFHHLLHLDLGNFNPKAPALITSSKQAMIRDNKSDIGDWVLRLREDTESALKVFGEDISVGCDLFTPTMLKTAYDPESETKVTVNGLSRELKRAGFRQANSGIPIKTQCGLQRLYVIRNPTKWHEAEPSECAAHFNQYFTTSTPKFAR